MKSVDFEKSNVTLGAGDNPNTSPIRIALCKNAQMPNYTSGFLVSKWEMDESEKEFFRKSLLEFLDASEAASVINCLPPIFLACMHSMSPVMVLQCPEEIIFSESLLIPDQEAADKANANRIKDN